MAGETLSKAEQRRVGAHIEEYQTALATLLEATTTESQRREALRKELEARVGNVLPFQAVSSHRAFKVREGDPDAKPPIPERWSRVGQKEVLPPDHYLLYEFDTFYQDGSVVVLARPEDAETERWSVRLEDLRYATTEEIEEAKTSAA